MGATARTKAAPEISIGCRYQKQCEADVPAMAPVIDLSTPVSESHIAKGRINLRLLVLVINALA